MKSHELKCWPRPFQATWDGIKLFELRKNDREFEVGDELLLREYDIDTEQYLNRSVKADITYISHCGDWMGVYGFVILGIKVTEAYEGVDINDT